MFTKYKWNFVAVVMLVSVVGFIVFDAIIYYSMRRYHFRQTFVEMQMKTQLALELLKHQNLETLPENVPALYDITYKIKKKSIFLSMYDSSFNYMDRCLKFYIKTNS